MLGFPIIGILILLGVVWSQVAMAFSGFYVAKSDTPIYNHAAKVVIVRHGEKTVLTMVNDFQGDVKEFAMVIPVPTLLKRKHVQLGNRAALDHLDDYSSPLFGEVRCNDGRTDQSLKPRKIRAFGVLPPSISEMSIEEQYPLREYEILILSAEENQGFFSWLRQHGYHIPQEAEPILNSYIKQGWKFLVVEVNINENPKLGFVSLSPLQITFKTSQFILPLQLGMVNAKGPQELFIYILTKNNAVQTTNYRAIPLNRGTFRLPLYVKNELPGFYKDMFAQQIQNENRSGVFMEFARDMDRCDPCISDSLTIEELRQLGVFWPISDQAHRGNARDAFLTRLHIGYDAERFPEDLIFQETSGPVSFRQLYWYQQAWTADENCLPWQGNRERLRIQHDEEAETLSKLTGWNLSDIRAKMQLSKGDGTK